MPIVGGLRARLIRDSLFFMVQDSLEALGWFDAGREHEPLTLIGKPQDLDEEIAFNTVALSLEDEFETPGELGSNLAEFRRRFYFDVFAQDEDIANDLSRDIRDILMGRYTSAGRTGPTLNVLDYREATPTKLFTAEINEVRIDRPRNFGQPWLAHMRMMRVEVIDAYGSE